MVGRRFGPIERHERLSDKVAAAIQRSIGDGELVQDDLLPTEMELSTQFEVSRTVIREAIRSLMGRGMLASGPGRRVMVAGGDASAAREALSRFIQAATELDYLKVHEVRATIEVQTAGLAAERAGPDDLAEAHAQQPPGDRAVRVVGSPGQEDRVPRLVAHRLEDERFDAISRDVARTAPTCSVANRPSNDACMPSSRSWPSPGEPRPWPTPSGGASSSSPA
jgi:DNA-binding transcriptional regulator YhcF (GntR family)